ncbi:hypothetical protein INR49_025068 [Caranx melampygus]|nr:hypothetical protein INR49_025068 [Caranx melampygus]
MMGDISSREHRSETHTHMLRPDCSRHDGRRFVSEEDNSVLKQGLQGWYAVLRGIQRMQSLDFSKAGHIMSSEKVLIHYLQDR